MIGRNQGKSTVRRACAGVGLLAFAAALWTTPIAEAQPPDDPAPAEAPPEAVPPPADDEPDDPARVTAEVDDVRVVAGLREGLQVEAPNAAGFVFQTHFAAWFRYVVDAPVDFDAAHYFQVPLARPLLQVSVLDGMFELLFQPELAGTPRLLDLQLDMVIDPAFRVRIGQFRTPASRAFATPIILLQMPGRGVVSNQFRAGRDTGLMIFGTAGAFEYAVGIFNGSGINGRLGDTPAPMGVARFVLTPYGEVPYDQTPSLTTANPSGLAIGVDGWYRERDTAPPATPPQVVQTANGSVDVSLVEGPFAIFAEGHLRGQSLGGAPWGVSWGAFVQAGIFVVPQIFEISARGAWVDPDTDVDGDLVQTYDATLAGYLYVDDVAYGNHLKLMLRYRFADTVTGFGPLPSGSSHQVMTQIQLWL